MGDSVAQLVEKSFPNVTLYRYTPDLKSAMGCQTRDDQLAAHRVPPQLMGIIPNNTGGFGDIEKAAAVFVANELEPLQETLSEFNDMIGQDVIRFAPFIAPALYRYLGRPRGGFFSSV